MEKNVHDWQKVLNGIVAKNSDKIQSVSDGDITKYHLSMRHANFEIIISPKWLGYELTLKRDVFGREIGHTLDTDNYPLSGEYTDVTKKIYQQTLTCLEGLLSGRVYVKTGEGGPVIAIPLPDQKYLIKTYKFKKHWWQFDTSVMREVEDSNLKNMDGLTALT